MLFCGSGVVVVCVACGSVGRCLVDRGFRLGLGCGGDVDTGR